MQRMWRLLVIAVVLGLVVWLWTILPVVQLIDDLRAWIVSLGVLGILAFALIYVVFTVVLGPASALTLMAGLVYGVWGFPLVILSGTLGAAVAFLIGRYLAYERVNRWLTSKPRLLALNGAVSEQGWRVVALMRLSPILPYGVQNYLFSVTHIGFVPYVLATIVGIMPATALYVYIGSLGQAIGTAGTLQWVLVAVGLVVTAAVALVIGQRANAALARQSGVDVRAVKDE